MISFMASLPFGGTTRRPIDAGRNGTYCTVCKRLLIFAPHCGRFFWGGNTMAAERTHRDERRIYASLSLCAKCIQVIDRHSQYFCRCAICYLPCICFQLLRISLLCFHPDLFGKRLLRPTLIDAAVMPKGYSWKNCEANPAASTQCSIPRMMEPSELAYLRGNKWGFRCMTHSKSIILPRNMPFDIRVYKRIKCAR